MLANGDEIADDIVADPAFNDLIIVAAEITADLLAAQSELPDEDVDAIARTTDEPCFAESMAPGSLLGYLGGDPADVQEMRSLADQLRADHGLEEASPQDIRYVFELVTASEDGQSMTAAALADELELEGGNQCDSACSTATKCARLTSIAEPASSGSGPTNAGLSRRPSRPAPTTTRVSRTAPGIASSRTR
ncbi:MAG: hypothetical protein IAG13_14180 [Deltaproteobacteria bacterium]|nr:hypothetical protein [Nannocystaceae bacterium]